MEMNDKANIQKVWEKGFDTTDDVEFGYMQHAYVYLKYINLYIYQMRESMRKYLPPEMTGEHPPFDYGETVETLVAMDVKHVNVNTRDMSKNGYHAKVMTHEDAQKVFKLKDDLRLTNLPKSIIPYEKARRIIFDCPDRILLMNCSCRSTRGDKGCWPRDVCMLIGEPWVSWGLENMKENNPRVITQEEALAIIKQQHEMGNVQSAFFKDACGDRMYGFCNCCTCCCVALAAQNYTGSPMFASSGYVRKVDLDKCVGCGICAENCHFMACKVVDGKIKVNPKKCKGCGVCTEKCPNGVNTLVLDDPEVSAPLDLAVLAPEHLRD